MTPSAPVVVHRGTALVLALGFFIGHAVRAQLDFTVILSASGTELSNSIRESKEEGDDFRNLYARGKDECDVAQTEICLPENCDLDTGRSHTSVNPQHNPDGFGVGGPGFGVFMTRVNKPGGGYATYTPHQKVFENSTRWCLTSSVKV